MISLFVVSLFFQSLSHTSDQKKVNYISFEKIDNAVEIWVDDAKVYASGIIEGNPELSLEVDIDEFLNDQSQTLTIKVVNGDLRLPDIPDKHWEIRFELFLDGEPVDYIWEYADDNTIGTAFEKEYVLSEWR